MKDRATILNSPVAAPETGENEVELEPTGIRYGPEMGSTESSLKRHSEDEGPSKRAHLAQLDRQGRRGSLTFRRSCGRSRAPTR